MKIWIICFTGAGAGLAGHIQNSLRASGEKADVFIKMKHPKKVEQAMDRKQLLEPEGEFSDRTILTGELTQWVQEAFAAADAILFIGACGIAVRSIAKHIRDKFTDPAVLVVDERGQFCISLLSGHVGGGNRLCEIIAKAAGAVPVITTATDINRKFAVDVFAAENHLTISDRQTAKEVSAAILAGEMIPMFCEKPLVYGEVISGGGEEALFEQGILLLSRKQLEAGHADNLSGCQMEAGHSGDMPCQNRELGIYVGIHCDRSPFQKTLFLVPKAVVLGIGCKAGIREQDIAGLIDESLTAAGIFKEAAGMAASIDIKQQESGILTYCQKHELPFTVFSAEELKELKGNFNGSYFVKQVTGVDSVCERSACRASGILDNKEKLLIEKQTGNGVTFAAAEKDWSIRYE